MNRKQAKELAPIITAFGDGKEIEIREDNEWIALGDHPSFGNVPGFYRVKPEPRVIYVDNKTNKIVGPHGAAKWQVTKFIEVIE